MDILESILTGNLGYGVIVLLGTIVFWVYKMFVEPRLKKADEFENEIEQYKELIKEKDKQIESSLTTIAEQQNSISVLTDTNAKQEETLNSLTKIETLENLSLKLQKELEEVVSKLKNKLSDVDEGLIKQERTLVSLTKELKDNLEPILEKNLRDLEKRMEVFERLIKEVNESGSSSLGQVGTQLANIENNMNQLKAQVAASKFSYRNNELDMQDIK